MRPLPHLSTTVQPPVRYLPCVMVSRSLAPPDSCETYFRALSKRRGGDWWQRVLCKGVYAGVIVKEERGRLVAEGFM